MPELAIRDWYRRENGNAVQFAYLNMFVEPHPAAPAGFHHISRYGLTSYATRGAGPIQGLFAKPGVFNGDLFTISNNVLYRGTTSLGAITGTGPVSWAASSTELVVTRGGTAYSYNGTNLAAIAFPDTANVTAVGFLNGLFLFARAGTHRFYWSTTNDARTIDGLDYASAESAPDELLDLYIVNDGLWLMGASSVEFWSYTGDADAPLSRVEGALYKKGIKATGCAAELDNTLFWWGHDDFIYRGAQGVPQAISNPAVNEWLTNSVLKQCFAFTHEGHPFFVVRTDSGTLLFDASTQKWSQFQTFGQTNWRVQDAAVAPDGLVFADDTTATIWKFDPANWSDGSVLERRFSSGLPISDGAVRVDKLTLHVNAGNAALTVDPVVEVRCSRDGGHTFEPWRPIGLGTQGEYRKPMVKRRWGLFDAPGGLFEVRVTDPAPFRVTSLFANEPSAGRGRRAP